MRRARTHLAALLALLAGGVPAGAQITTVDLERSGTGYPVFRIPALAVTTRGTLLAAYDGRPTGADVPSNIALLLRRSTDGGHSWSDRQVVRYAPAPNGFGDPSLLVDRTTGRVFSVSRGVCAAGFFRVD